MLYIIWEEGGGGKGEGGGERKERGGERREEGKVECSSTEYES